MSFDNLKMVLEELADTRARIKADTERADELSALVKSAVSGAVSDTLVGDVMFSVRLQAGRKSFDTALMAADGIDVAKYEKVGAPIAVLSVKRVSRLD